MKYLPSICIPLALAVFTTTAFADPFSGPLSIQNGHPLYAAIGSPSLTSAEPESSFDLAFSYSSTFRTRGSNEWYYGIDCETAITDIQLTYLTGKHTEIGLDIPVIRYGPGFMDGAIETFHNAIGPHNAYGRNNRPRNQFFLQVDHNGQIVIQGEPGKTALGDIRVEAKHAFYQDVGSTVSLNAFLNLPTGDADAAFGSGKSNGGMAVLVNERLGSSLLLYLNAGIGLIDKLEALQTVDLRNYYFGGLGLEWSYSSSLSLNAQAFIQSSPFQKSDIFFIDDPSVLASFGGRSKLGARSSLGIAATEDPNTSGAPDIMISADYRRVF